MDLVASLDAKSTDLREELNMVADASRGEGTGKSRGTHDGSMIVPPDVVTCKSRSRQAKSNDAGPGVTGCNGFPNGGDDERKAPKFEWHIERGAMHNYRKLGRRLATVNGKLFRNGKNGHGLVSVSADGKSRLILKSSDLAPILADTLRMIVLKCGKTQRELPTAEHLNSMLKSEVFLSEFRPLDGVVAEPIYGGNFKLVVPGYNNFGDGNRLYYCGVEPRIVNTTATIREFLDLMDFASPADRTNAVAAALTIPLRRLWVPT